jgi:hypothetical protein
MPILRTLLLPLIVMLLLSFGFTLAYADQDPTAPTLAPQADTAPPTFPANPLLNPAHNATVATFQPGFDWADAVDAESGVVSYTLIMTSGVAATTVVSTTTSAYTSTSYLMNGVYTWTVRAYDAAGNVSEPVAPPNRFTLQATATIFLPILTKSICPATSTNSYSLIPIEGPIADRPDYLHGDLNLALRGYEVTSSTLALINTPGSTDPNAPQLAGLFEPNRFPGISSVYQIYDWNWNCGPNGCRGSLITNPAVTLAGLSATPGESLHIPERSPEIYGGGYRAMVLYAEERRLTLGYTRQDTVANGYTVHLENICVDPNLLALYRAQVDAGGFHASKRLPGLRNNQPVGTALDSEVKVVIRDRGAFMDPRSRKDWWQGY